VLLVNYLGGLILLHLCQLIGNAHAVTELRESDNGDVQQVSFPPFYLKGFYPESIETVKEANSCCPPPPSVPVAPREKISRH
jgi:hypothetical protein